jgi:hypothetical protein
VVGARRHLSSNWRVSFLNIECASILHHRPGFSSIGRGETGPMRLPGKGMKTGKTRTHLFGAVVPHCSASAEHSSLFSWLKANCSPAPAVSRNSALREPLSSSRVYSNGSHVSTSVTALAPIRLPPCIVLRKGHPFSYRSGCPLSLPFNIKHESYHNDRLSL